MHQQTFRPILQSVVFALSIVFSAATAGHAQAAAADDLKTLPGRPVQVRVSVDVVEVSQIVDHEQKFECEFYVYYVWKDARLAFDAAREGRNKRQVPVDDIWTPDAHLVDDLDVNVESPREAHVHADGTVTLRQYFRGTLSADFDLHEFPLDQHLLEVNIEAGSNEADEVMFVAGDAHPTRSTGTVPNGWNLRGMTAVSKVNVNPRLQESYSRVVLQMHVERSPHYYFWSIVLPLVPILLTSLSVFWMDPKEFSSQISVAVTAMLTVVAYRITIDSSLPNLIYMTRMDYFLLICQTFVFGGFIALVAIHVCHASGSAQLIDLARRLNQHCRWLPGLAMVALCTMLATLPPLSVTVTLVAALFLAFLRSRPTFSRVRTWLTGLFCPEKFFEAETTAGQHKPPLPGAAQSPKRLAA